MLIIRRIGLLEIYDDILDALPVQIICRLLVHHNTGVFAKSKLTHKYLGIYFLAIDCDPNVVIYNCPRLAHWSDAAPITSFRRIKHVIEYTKNDLCEKSVSILGPYPGCAFRS